jgi:choline dehydrogenase
VQPLSLDKFGDPLHRFPAVMVSACNLQPTSRGTIQLRSRDPSAKPVIAPNISRPSRTAVSPPTPSASRAA